MIDAFTSLAVQAGHVRYNEAVFDLRTVSEFEPGSLTTHTVAAHLQVLPQTLRRLRLTFLSRSRSVDELVLQLRQQSRYEICLHDVPAPDPNLFFQDNWVRGRKPHDLAQATPEDSGWAVCMFANI